MVTQLWMPDGTTLFDISIDYVNLKVFRKQLCCAATTATATTKRHPV